MDETRPDRYLDRYGVGRCGLGYGRDGRIVVIGPARTMKTEVDLTVLCGRVVHER